MPHFTCAILEADLASQEQKNRNLESNLDRIDKLENLVSWLVEQGEVANTRISDLTSHECKCLHSRRVSSEYMTDQRYSSSSSSSELHGNSNERCSFSAQPPICTIDILTPEHSRQTRNESTPAGKKASD